MKTETLIKFFGGGCGSQARIAKALGISRAAVSKWGDTVPPGSAYALCRMYPDLDALDKKEWQQQHDLKTTPKAA